MEAAVRRGGGINSIHRGESAIHQHFRGTAAIALEQLIEHGFEQALIGALIGHGYRHHGLGFHVRGQLHVVGWPEATIGTFHHPRLGVRGGSAWRFVALLFDRGWLFASGGPAGRRIFAARLGPRGFQAVGFDLLQRIQCPPHALVALARRPLPRGLLAPVAGSGIRLEFLLERRHLGLRLGQILFEPGSRLRRETRTPRAGAHAHSVLRHAMHAHRAAGQQGRHAAGQQLIQERHMRHPEVRERVVVHAHAIPPKAG
jgi:hypothetical protein